VRRANGTGASIGLVVGMVSVFIASLTELSWLYYNVLGAVVVVVVGLLWSFTGQGKRIKAPGS